MTELVLAVLQSVCINDTQQATVAKISHIIMNVVMYYSLASNERNYTMNNIQLCIKQKKMGCDSTPLINRLYGYECL